jgi:hypothetical protein
MDVCAEQIEKILIRVNALNIKFNSQADQRLADELHESIVESLESLLDLVMDEDCDVNE